MRIAHICSLILLLPFLVAGQEPVGIKNFHSVNANLYRGAQPTDEGFKALAKMGVKTVIDLRDRSQQHRHEERIVEGLGMKFLSVPMTMSAPTDEQIAKVLGQFESSTAWPVFVHCLGGRDRTGTAIACYRIAHDGWDSQKALAEAREYGMRLLDIGMERYVRQFHSPSAQVSGGPNGRSVATP
jgi:protein tyrosine/serine phosphatase